MDKHNFRSYVIAVESDDEYDDSVTHVAIELRPSAILRLVWKSLLARIVHKIADALEISCGLETPFDGITWLNWQNSPGDDDAPEEWDGGTVLDEIAPELVDEGGLMADYAGLCSRWIYFTCFHKHSGTDFTSHDVPLTALVKAIRWSDVLAELRPWVASLFIQASPADSL